MNMFENYSPQLVDAIQKGSANELVAHLETLFAAKVQVERFHPLLAMLMTTLTPLRSDKDPSKTVFNPVSSIDIYDHLVIATEANKLQRLADILRHYLKTVSADMMRRQLAYHSWASTTLVTKEIAGSTLVPANREAKVILPFSLLVTPVKPSLYKASSKLLDSAEISASFDWIRSMTIF